jgi:hypothetical protein
MRAVPSRRSVAAALISLCLGAGSGMPAPSPAAETCEGLRGDALQSCLQGESKGRGARQITFFGPDGKGHDFVYAAASRSIAVVCQAITQDGLYVAYRTEADWKAKRPWKEVECRSGKIAGLWKEYFRDNETTTVLSYDASGTAVKQALYLNDRLVGEKEFSRRSR